MSGIFDDNNRQVIPRWLDYRTSCALGLLAGAQPQRSPLIVFPSDPKKLTDWETTPNIATATDLVAENFFLETYAGIQTKNAAHFILKHAPQESFLVRELATTFLQQGVPTKSFIESRNSPNHDHRYVTILKKSVRANPANPVAWSDLSLCYVMRGLPEKARRAMIVALSLGPHNRFILRNAARCFLHLQDPERAIHLLRQSGLCESDPWIAAAEIAVSDGLQIHSNFIKHAHLHLSNNNNSPFAKSEIAAALSTIEIEHGASKKAKDLIKLALVDPSENALAQIEWLTTELHINPPPSIILPASFEAKARQLHRAKMFKQSLTETEKWFHFQPFSSSPLIMATFLASVCLNDDSRAIQLANKAISGNKPNVSLLNNLAFAYARQGNITAAIDTLSQIQLTELPERESLIVGATRGLILFRCGHEQEGRALYHNAVIEFDKLSESRLAAFAAFFWACEEKLLATADTQIRIADAKKRIKCAGAFELEDAAKNL